MKEVGIIYNSMNVNAVDLANKLHEAISSSQQMWINSSDDVQNLSEQIRNSDMIITVGGDGTILRVNRI
ncbi:MAG: NAD(+)/NADH kinase, partial [SAR202 cluster bacterium]|nr:NAD(+)/NADH kinase [SAR202 cluster bacterium]